MSDARKCAICALGMADKGRHAQAALAAVKIDGQARQMCTELVYGTLRTRPRIMRMLADVLPKARKLPHNMLIALQMAVYSLFFQEQEADYAIVNETVQFVKKQFGQKLANVANAALRGLLAQNICYLPADFAETAQFFAMPRQIADIWHSAYGETNAIALMRRSFQRPRAALRVNARHKLARPLLSALSANADACKIGEFGFAFAQGKTPDLLLNVEIAKLHAEGAISWQAAGSQLALQKLGIHTDWRHAPIWDACAGIGGKTLAMLENGLRVTLATDTSMRRLASLRPQCLRLSLPMPFIAAADLRKPPVKKWHGHILADAPCSGTGVLARRPDIKLRHIDFAQLRQLQTALLHALFACLEPGFELAYITCALNPAENEEQIQKLARTFANAEIICQWQTPHAHPWLEGMYACRMRKN